MMQKRMKPFKEVKLFPPKVEEVHRMAREMGVDVDTVVKEIALSLSVPTYQNNYYQVQKRAFEGPHGAMFHLAIRRLDRKPIHDWDDFQQIKNELVGPLCEGCELYPSVAREHHDRSTFHLYVFMTTDKMFPFGMGPQKSAEEKAMDSARRLDHEVQSV